MGRTGVDSDEGTEVDSEADDEELDDEEADDEEADVSEEEDATVEEVVVLSEEDEATEVGTSGDIMGGRY